MGSDAYLVTSMSGFVTTDSAALGAVATVVSSGGAFGTVSGPAGSPASTTASDTNDMDLYQAIDSATGTIAVVVTESAATTATTYNYVAQCSNRGTCDSATGLCKCFKGYSNDNRNEQNMLAQ